MVGLLIKSTTQSTGFSHGPVCKMKFKNKQRIVSPEHQQTLRHWRLPFGWQWYRANGPLELGKLSNLSLIFLIYKMDEIVF